MSYDGKLNVLWQACKAGFLQYNLAQRLAKRLKTCLFVMEYVLSGTCSYITGTKKVFIGP